MIYKRGNRWWYRIKWSLKKDASSRETFVIQRSAKTSRKREAQDAESEHRHALRLGLVHPLDQWPKVNAPASPTLREFSKRFLEHSEAHTSRGTQRFYRSCTENLLRYSPLADMILSDLTGESLTRRVAWRKANVPKPSIARINGEIRTLRRMLNLAYEWGLIPKPVVVHTLPGEEGRQMVISFVQEGKYLLEASPNLHDAAVLAAETGLRPNSELFCLRWENVHLEPSENAANGFLHVTAGKTENAPRNIPLTVRAREVLLGRKGNKSRFVFPGPGKAGYLVTVQHTHERAIKAAEIPYFPFYCWRHTFGTRCAEAGMDRFSLARLMGHSSPKVAERYYIHVSETHVAAGFDKFEAYRTAKQIEAFPKQSEAVQ